MSIEDRYAFTAPLEEGRFGTLSRAVDRKRAAAGGRAEVVIWLSPPELARNAPALAAIRRDLERVRELDHPNITRVLEIGQDGDRVFVVSDFADGETLRNVLDALGTERLEAREADAVIESLRSALAHAHDSGIVHGDVRAENVIVMPDQRVELANFMLASAARGTPFAPTVLDDSQALAALADELRRGADTHDLAPERSPEALPRRRRPDVETALGAGDAAAAPVPEFVPMTGLECDPEPPRRSHRAGGSAAAARLTLFLAGFAAIGAGVALYRGDDAEWPWSPGAAVREPQAAAAESGVVEHEATEHDATAGGEHPDPTATPTAPIPVAARTAPPALRTGSQPSAVTPSARDTAVADQRPDAPEARRAPANAPRRETTLSARPVTARENEGVAKVTVVRSGDLSRRFDFVWHTVEATAHAGDDYADFGARIESFPPGVATRTLSVPLASDAVREASETFYVRFDVEREAGPRFEPTSAEVRIIDDDARNARR